MKKYVLATTVILCSSFISFAQSLEKGDINLELGVGYGVYATKVTTTFAGISETEKDGTVSFIIPIKAKYTLSDRFGIGLLVQPESYLEDSDSSAVKEETFKGSTLRVFGAYYLVNHDKFNFHIELGIGLTSFNQESRDIKSGDKFKAKWKGGNFSLGLGMNYFFIEHVGLFVNIDYNSYSFKLNEFEINGTSLKADNWKANFSGVETSIGLAVKF